MSFGLALASDFARRLPEVLLVLIYAYGLLLIVWPFILVLERRYSAGRRTPTSNFVFNAKVMLFNFVVTPIFWTMAVVASSAVAGFFGLPALPYPDFAWLSAVPVLGMGVQAIALYLTACFLGDFWYYWWHRMQHERPMLWEIHKLHHSDEDLNVTTLYRSHFLELAGQALVRGMTVGLVVDLEGVSEAPLAIVFAGLLPPVWDAFIHANVRFDRLRWLQPWLSTPQFHWIHHSTLPEHQDKNFAIWLPIFDVVFGTYYAPAVGEYPPTGLSSGERLQKIGSAQIDPIRVWVSALGARLFPRDDGPKGKGRLVSADGPGSPRRADASGEDARPLAR